MARILVVEDSPDIRVLIRLLLESAGHHVLAAPDGQQGVETARREKPDLVLMDLSLPLLSGWEATRQLKSDPATSGIPVVAVTAHAMQGDRERALAAGCEGFIPKPIDEETFGVQVGFFLRREAEVPVAAEGVGIGGQEAGPAEGGRILVVDDERDAAELLRLELESAGHSVTLAGGAADALARFVADPRFDLAVVDVRIGEESGYDLTMELISQSPEYLPVLLVTAGEVDRERGYEVGADDFIAKPIDAAEVKARARALIRIGRAIREQGRAMRAGAEAYDRLVELDRLKSDFLSTVSHELRTPLNTIILLSHLIEREGKSPADSDRRIHDVRVIRESAETLLRMINNILDLAKLEAGQRDLHPQRFALLPFLHEMADVIEPQARTRGLELDLEFDEELPASVVLDREKLSRALINLLSNAVKYTAQGRVTFRCSPWQESVYFAVEDTGSGIPAHLIGPAFEPFRQIRTGSGEAPRGTGLGLSISKQLVEVMGGDLLFDSREGVGTKVSFTLPQLEDVAEMGPSPPEEKPVSAVPSGVDASGRPLRVLIVEDDAASRYGLKSLLATEGYEVAEAATLAEANGEIQSQPPAVVILDITLPDGDGAEWLKLSQRRAPLRVPVIALTGVTADEDRRRIEAAGVCAVLHKPVNVNLLLEALRECARQKSAAKEAPHGVEVQQSGM